jgi:MoaE-MoaD fusion protein
MRVKVLFFGVLKDMTGCSEDFLEIAPNTTLASVFDAYTERFATLRDKRPSILFARNREFSKPDTMLSDNDEIAFLPPVSGGSDKLWRQEDGHIFAITHDPLDSRAVAEILKRPEDGAVVIFEGVVRNNTRGRATSHLEYECYPEMALPHMMRIGREIAAASRIGHIAIVHRLGRIAIGEASVAVVVTAPHRRPAFEAALAGIDRLKREVPIWKKEIFADGAEWVEGEWGENLLSHLTTNEAK